MQVISFVALAAGLIIGLPAAFAATRVLRTLLFETAPHDAVSFAAATVIVSAVGAVAWIGWSRRTMMKFEPSPGLLVTSMVPPSMLAKCLVMVSPSPVPP